MEYATFNFTASQQLVLRASPVALAFSAARGPQATAVRAKKPEEVEKEARARVVSEGGDPGNATLVLSRHSIQFGKYQGQTFKWLLENDAGYAIQLVHSHQRERETNTMTSPLMANKDALAQYSCAHQVFISHLKFHRAHEEAWARASQPGREGEALVGFGQFKGDTLKDLYESTDKYRQGFVKWLRRKTPQPGTAMDAARKYILRRDAERPAATAAGSSSSSSSTSTTTTAGASSFPPFPTSSTSTAATRGLVAPAVSALLGRRPMGPGELQAKVKKMMTTTTPRPAVPAVSRPQRGQPPSVPPPPSVDVTDEELVQAALDVELADVQVLQGVGLPLPVVAPPPPPPPAPSPPPPPPRLAAPPTLASAPAPTPQPVVTQEPRRVSVEETPSGEATLAPAPAQRKRKRKEKHVEQPILSAPAAAEPTIPESWRTTLSREQQEWVGRALFTIDSRGKTSLTTDLNLWWDPPQPRPTFAQPPASPAAFFACRLFL
ncbi:hypothetical protein ACEWY4_024494 [Coilia grayii]|uniref:DUF6729 domain-containing protein n=1 Tax=Coilia grayii TaxID=363190 RepID=A0ABD1J250_9TELE